jgi:zinc/manganese transport system substrate-binding protein
MHRRLLLSAPLLASGWGFGPAVAASQVQVIASFSILADLLQRVGGDRVAVQTLVGPDRDVHTFQPRPSDLGRVKDAAAVVENGLFLEPWLPRMERSAGFHGRSIVASAGIPTRTFTEGGASVTDPHVWQDPRNAARMVATIGAGLAAVDAAGAEAYQDRASAFAAEIMAADAEIARTMEAIPPERRRIITSHDAFGYYGARYGVGFRAPQGISTEGEPTPKDLARLAAQIRREGIRAVFVENMTDPRLAAALAREAGAVVGAKVYSDSLSPPDGPAGTYLAMLRHNTRLFAAAMAA